MTPPISFTPAAAFAFSVWTGMKRGMARVLPIPGPEPLNVSVEAQIARLEAQINRSVLKGEIGLDLWESDIKLLEDIRRANRERRDGNARP